MTKELLLNSGEIVLVHSETIIARLIQWFENLSNRLKGKSKEFKYNHVGLGIGENQIAEAVESGIEIKDFVNAYGRTTNKTILIYEIPNLTDEQKQQIKDFSKSLEGVPYQYNNFLQHIVSILTFGTLWPEKSEKFDDKLYCSEFVSMVLWTVLKLESFRSWWKVRPDEIQDYAARNWILKRRYVI